MSYIIGKCNKIILKKHTKIVVLSEISYFHKFFLFKKKKANNVIPLTHILHRAHNYAVILFSWRTINTQFNFITVN